MRTKLDIGRYSTGIGNIQCFDALGEDRVIFATNWGVCTHFGMVDDVVRIVSEFLQSKSETALKKGMRENAIRVYGISAKHLRDS